MNLKKFFAIVVTATSVAAAIANNPIVTTLYTADPAPMVYGDRMYVYIDRDEGNLHDANNPNNTYFHMNEWRVYSSADMVNWTDHGAALPLTTFAWSEPGTAWASQCIERNGKFYWYVCCHPKGSGVPVLGVAVADSPTGPFEDALGRPFIQGGWGYIDPTPFIDDDGHAYLYWGNPGCFYVKLNEDMISYSGTVKEIPQTEESFGGPKDPKDGVQYTDLYEEGPWLCKRDGKYYLLYAAGGVPEHLSYSMADSPTGPWHYKGQIMPNCDTNSFTNHCGVAHFKGNDYLFYHTGWLPNGHGFNRAIAVEQFEYNADGTFPIIMPTRAGVAPVGTLSPYERVEGETMAWSEGLQSFTEDDGTIYVGNHGFTISAPAYYAHSGDIHLVVRNVDFGSQPKAKGFFGRVRSNRRNSALQVHIDDIDGEIIAQLNPSSKNWEERVGALSKGITGVHDLYFTWSGRLDLDCWEFLTEAADFDDPVPAQWEVVKNYLTLSDDCLVVDKWWDGKHHNVVDPVAGTIYIHGRPGEDPEGDYYGGQVGWVFNQPIKVKDWEKFTITMQNVGPTLTSLNLYQNGLGGYSVDMPVSDSPITTSWALSDLKVDKKAMTQIDAVYFWGYWGGAVNIKFNEAYFSKKVQKDPSGIENVTADKQGEEGIFSLDGRRMRPGSDLAPGIYIINGQKTLVK